MQLSDTGTMKEVLFILDGERNDYEYRIRYLAEQDTKARLALQAKIEALNMLRKRFTREILGQP